MPLLKNIVGNKYNKLLVLKRDLDWTGTGVKWICKCDCGNIVSVDGRKLKNNHTKSCGCIHKEVMATKRKSNRFEYMEDYVEVYDDKNNMFIIDIEDVEKTQECYWRLNNGYVVNSKQEYLHRYLTNCPDDKVVDHINRKPIDNRRENLRICTQQENLRNVSAHKDNSVGVLGVYIKDNKYHVKIYVNEKQIIIGKYKTLQEAITARKNAEIEHYGKLSSWWEEYENGQT